MEFYGSFKNIEHPQKFIMDAFDRARKQNKYLLFVLGGNWCHDSRSLAKKLQDPILSKTIEQKYLLEMVDVGFLDKAYEFVEKAGMHTYYATPTVLIFDPVSGRQINSEDMHVWANAFNISQEDSNLYFENYSQQNPQPEIQLSKVQQQHLVRLEQFVSQQQLRIKSGYQIVGPLLERYKAKHRDSEFQPYWVALAELRNQLPEDTRRLRQLIIAGDENSLDNIQYPDYPPLPWE